MGTLHRILFGGGAGDPSWRAVVTPALELLNRLTARLSEVAAGVTVSQGPFSLRTDQKPALAISTRLSSVQTAQAPALAVSLGPSSLRAAAQSPAFAISQAPHSLRTPQSPALALIATVSGTPTKAPVNPALAITHRISSGVAASQVPAYDLTQVQFNLTHRKGGVTATTSGPGWANAADAQGNNDGTSARNTGAALDPALATLKLNYTDLANKSSLTISAVRLVFYSQLANVLLNDSTVTFEYSLDNGAGWTVLQTVTADYDDIPAGRTFTLSPVPTLAQVQALEARMTVDFPIASATKTLDIDAIELEVVAAETWAL